MKLNFRRERVFSPRAVRFLFFLLVASIVPAPLSHGAPVGSPVLSVREMARLEAADPVDRNGILALYHGYVSLGLQKEAVSFLDRKINLAELTREEATPLFERIVVEQSRWDEPASFMATCEAALRNGIRTPLILYSYGTGLRLAGRLSDASSILSKVGVDSPLHLFALYAIGQIAAEEGNTKSALEMFERVRMLAKDRPELDRRVSRSQAELLLISGRPAEAVPLFEAVISRNQDPLVTIGMAAARKESPSGEENLRAEMIAGMPVRERVLLSLLLGGLARERGDYVSALDYMTRSEGDLKSSLLSSFPPATERLEGYKSKDIIERQITAHSVLRRELTDLGPGQDPNLRREPMVELLLRILFMDHAISRSIGSLPPAPNLPPVPISSSREIEEVFRKIEQVALDGVSLDELVEEITKKIELFQNLAHPMPRFRQLSKLEENHKEILRIKGKIRNRREEAIAGVQTGDEEANSRLLRDLGQFLVELEETRIVASEAREFMGQHFDLLKAKKVEKKRSSGELPRMVTEVLAFDNERFAALLLSVQALEERARISSWEKKRQEILVLRPIVLRQFADTLLAQAYSLRASQPPGWSRRASQNLDQAMSTLSDEGVSHGEKAEIAVNIASFLVQGEGHWEVHPGRRPGEAERKMIARILPLLDDSVSPEGVREKNLALRALLKMSIGASDATSAARDFLKRTPSSPLAGDIAVRLGNDAMLAGKLAEATEFYKLASGVSRPGPSSIAQYMLGWVHYHNGDAEGAVEELVPSLTDPAFACGKLAPFEKSVLALAVHAWMDLPTDRLASYPPVQEGRCGGKILLTSLGEAEEKRGETPRAAVVFDVLASRFSSDEDTLAYEMKSVEDLLRAGREDEAFSRALTLKEKYGPGSAWAESQPPAVRKKAHERLAKMLETLSERKFDEGIRSGNRSAMADAAVGMEQFFAVKGAPSLISKPDLRLKWAISALKAGDRETGIGILEELLMEERSGTIGERAAILYAETMIAGYERKEQTAEDAEKGALLLLERFPSEKAVSLAYRAAVDMVDAGDYEHAARTASSLEENQATPKALLQKARLVQAEAYVFMSEYAKARGKANQILAVAKGKEVEPKSWERAKDLLLLSSLKEVEERTAAGDWIGAAKMLEDLVRRFPEAPEAPGYSLRAVRSYREGGDPEGAIRIGTFFLEKYPLREESVEITGVIGTYLEERKEYLQAADAYAEVANRLPKNPAAGRFLFRSARLSLDHGDPKGARSRFSSYRDRYSTPRWMNAYAVLSLGLQDWEEGKIKPALRGMEEGLRSVDAGVEPDAPKELFEVAGKAQIAIGEYWADQFRRLKLTAPLEKNLAIKDRFFRRSLEAFEKAERKAPLEVALSASQLSGDLLVEFGKAILSSQQPKGMSEEERAQYEEALAGRARPFFERSLDWYIEALDRLEAEKGPSEFAIPLRQRLEEAQRLLAGIPAPQGGK